MSKGNLITNYAERMERAREKKKLILSFIQHWTYTTLPVLTEYIGVDAEAVSRTANRLEEEGFIKRIKRSFAGQTFYFYVITSHGATENIVEGRKIKEFKRIGFSRLEHTLDTQRVHANSDWVDWNAETWLPGKDKKIGDTGRWQYYPDARAKIEGSDGEIMTVAIEIERCRKSPARYGQIMKMHIKNIYRKRYQYVMYFVPKEKDQRILEMLMKRVAKRFQIDVDRYFGFYPYPFKP